MIDPDLVMILQQSLGKQSRAMEYLAHSLEDCAALADDTPMTPRELAFYEALASRFARASDMLVNKVFRALDAVEFYEGGTPLDVINRADKPGLIEDMEVIRQIRRIRNRIAHEYNVEDFPKFMNDIRVLNEKLSSIFHRTQAYAEKLTAASGAGSK